jgi:muramoyltetrapeptide carboxypeptidase
METLHLPPPIFPPRITQGGRIQVLLPAGPVVREELERGLARVRQYLTREIVLPPNVESRSGYFAGSDHERLGALARAFADEDAELFWCARGGYGTTRILHHLDPGPLLQNPRLLIGFSDITALLAWAYVRAGVASLHGPVLTQLGRLNTEDAQDLFSWINGEVPAPLCADAGTTVCGGTVEGRLFAANLEVLRTLIGTPFFPPLEGAILAIEEVNERPYRIDRTLTHLITSGSLRGVRAVIVGQLENCDGEPSANAIASPTAHDVVVERLEQLGIPVVTGFPFGHAAHAHKALPFGAMARLWADQATIEFLEPITAERRQ